jgi:hypothetical protein
MAPRAGGRANLSKAKARPQSERFGRLLDHRFRAAHKPRQDERLRAAVAAIKRRFVPDAIAFAADLLRAESEG